MKTLKQQSKKTLGDLFADLGFGVGKRDPKEIKTALNDFRKKRASTGNPLPTQKLGLAEAREIAIEFCGNDQGLRLWPPTTLKEKVWSWALDRPK